MHTYNNSLLFVCSVIFHDFFLLSADFSQNYFFFQNIHSGTLSDCQMVWIQIRIVIMSFLIWVQTVCKGYQQTEKIATRKETFNYKWLFHCSSHFYFIILFCFFFYENMLWCSLASLNYYQFIWRQLIIWYWIISNIDTKILITFSLNHWMSSNRAA